MEDLIKSLEGLRERAVQFDKSITGTMREAIKLVKNYKTPQRGSSCKSLTTSTYVPIVFGGDKQTDTNVGLLKPTIPQMVADWITDEQKNYSSLTHAFAQVNAMHAFGQYGSQESRDKRDATKKWIIENEMVFAVAWDKGFEVEQEKKYRVKLPDGGNKPDKFFALVKRDNCITIERVKANKYKYEKSYRLTEHEISLNHEYLWEFAKPVEEK